MKRPTPLDDNIYKAHEQAKLRSSARSTPLTERFRGIPHDQEIKSLLDSGLDAYRITQMLGCRYVDVLNVARTVAGMRLVHDDLQPLPDTQELEPQARLSLFPPLE